MAKKEKHNSKIRKMINENITNQLNNDMDITDVLLVLCNNIDSKNCDLSIKEKIFKVVYHAKRVYENINTITNHLQNNGIILTVDEYEDLYIASLFHDIGKLYKDSKRHPEFSAIIFDNISDLIFRDLSISRKSRIIQMIYNHGNKLDKDPSLLYTTKILRDADLFDEKCGDSLLALALNNVVSDREIDKIKNKDIHELSGVLTKNLNKCIFKFSDLVIEDANSKSFIESNLNKINIELNKDLYIKLLKDATDKYKDITNYDDRHNIKTGHKLMNKYTCKIDIQ